MAIVGFNFTKILAEKKTAIKGNVDIKNNVSIKGVESTDLAIGNSKEKALKFIFEFSSEYSPDVGGMLFSGDIVTLSEPAKQDEILKSWKKNKQIPKEVMGEILNTVLMRCNVEALMLSRDVNLPPPIPMPKVQK
jgi:hypothetical protein